jgi:nucleotide-binding universal stress UspA family protein
MDRIIAATDLTARSHGVLGRATLAARALGAGTSAPASVCHVHVLPAGASPAREADARARIAAELTQTPGAGDVPSEIRILRGRPESALAEIVAESRATLLILGLHRARPVLDLLRLTTMERIVLRANVPVLIAQAPPKGPYARVLASVDFAPACAAALAAAARLAPAAEFHAIHALHLELREKFAPGNLEHSRAMTQAQALRTVFLALPGLPPNLEMPEIVPGGVHEVLAFRIDELHPDLLTIGTHSGRDPGALGNYARDLMRAPPTDVLVAKPAPA